MLLSSLRRLRLVCAGMTTDPITDNLTNNRLLKQWLSATSQQIEKFLNRELHIEIRTEYFDVTYMRDEYWPKAYPISSITSVYSDSTGLYDGSESEESDYYIGIHERSVCLDTTFDWIARKGLRIIYTGGLAYDPVKSIFSLASIAGTFTIGKYAIGNTSGAVGIISAWSTPALTVENYHGIFISGEIISQYDNEAGTTPVTPTVYGTISAITRQSLAEAYPAITQACESQVRYYWKHTTDFENNSTTKDGNTLRRNNPQNLPQNLQTEALMLLEPFRSVF